MNFNSRGVTLFQYTLLGLIPQWLSVFMPVNLLMVLLSFLWQLPSLILLPVPEMWYFQISVSHDMSLSSLCVRVCVCVCVCERESALQECSQAIPHIWNIVYQYFDAYIKHVASFTYTSLYADVIKSTYNSNPRIHKE